MSKQEDDVRKDPDDVLVSDWWSKYYEAIGGDPKLKRLFRERNLPTIKVIIKLSTYNVLIVLNRFIKGFLGIFSIHL